MVGVPGHAAENWYPRCLCVPGACSGLSHLLEYLQLTAASFPVPLPLGLQTGERAILSARWCEISQL